MPLVAAGLGRGGLVRRRGWGDLVRDCGLAVVVAGGSGWRSRIWWNQSQFLLACHDRVPSHFRQIRVTSCRNLPSAFEFPVIP